MSCDFEGCPASDFEYEDWAFYQERDMTVTDPDTDWPVPSKGFLKGTKHFK